MTINEAITFIDNIKPNTFSLAEKIRWLSNLDGIIKHEIVDTHEGADEVVYEGYTEDTPLETELIAPHPYDEVYTRYLEAQIDYYNGENKRFNNSIALYNAAFINYKNWYNRTHKPISKPFKVF